MRIAGNDHSLSGFHGNGLDFASGNMGNTFPEPAGIHENQGVTSVGDEDIVVPEKQGNCLDLQLGGELGACARIITVAAGISEKNGRSGNKEKAQKGE